MFKVRSRPRRWSRRRRGGIRGYSYQEIDPNEDVVAQYQAKANQSSYASVTRGQPSIPNRYPAISEEVPRNADCPCGSERKFKKCHGKYEWLPRWIPLPKQRRGPAEPSHPPDEDE